MSFLLLTMPRPVVHCIHPEKADYTVCGRSTLNFVPTRSRVSSNQSRVTCRNCLSLLNGDRISRLPPSTNGLRARPYPIQAYLSEEAYRAWQSLPNKTEAVNAWLEGLADNS